jgi:ferredoxin
MKHRTWPRPSTRAFAREARRTDGYSFFDWLHGYVYARWPYLYISIGLGENPWVRRLSPSVRLLGRFFSSRSPDGAVQASVADTFHGKVVPPKAAAQLVTVEEDVRLTDLEQAIPYAAARDIVLQHPEHLVVVECPCRAARSNPCQPLDVCLIIGEPFASFIAEHHQRRSRWVSPGEAVDILRAEHNRGRVHHAFFKDAMLGRFYAICNCCACCCGAMQAWRRGTPLLASSGYVSRADLDLCTGCGLCADFCQFRAVSVDNGHAVVDAAACMGCGVCVSKCAQDALSLVRDPSRSAPLEIRELIASCGKI